MVVWGVLFAKHHLEPLELSRFACLASLVASPGSTAVEMKNQISKHSMGLEYLYLEWTR